MSKKLFFLPLESKTLDSYIFEVTLSLWWGSCMGTLLYFFVFEDFFELIYSVNKCTYDSQFHQPYIYPTIDFHDT